MPIPMPFAMFPLGSPLIEVAQNIGINPIFRLCLEPISQPPQIPNNSNILPVTPLLQPQSSANAHKYRQRLNKALPSNQFLMIREPISIKDAIHAIKHPDINLLLIRIRELPALLTREIRSLIESYQKPILIDLSDLLHDGFHRVRTIFQVLRVHQRISPQIPFIPITMPTASNPYLLRDPASILSLLQLLQMPTEHYLTNTRKIISNLITDLSSEIGQIQKQAPIEASAIETPEDQDDDEPTRFSLSLPPIWRSTPRIPRRYLAYRLHFLDQHPLDFDELQLQKTLNSMFRYLFGVITSAHTHIRVIKWQKGENLLILRTTPITVPHLTLLMALLTQINGAPIIPQLLRRSGTIHSLAKHVHGLKITNPNP